jgi:hypothetical protein
VGPNSITRCRNFLISNMGALSKLHAVAARLINAIGKIRGAISPNRAALVFLVVCGESGQVKIVAIVSRYSEDELRAVTSSNI